MNEIPYEKLRPYITPIDKKNIMSINENSIVITKSKKSRIIRIQCRQSAKTMAILCATMPAYKLVCCKFSVCFIFFL